MGNLKKVISLHQASIISGYHQDYLSSLLRKSELRGQKLGGNWFTTEEEIKNYIFKQKIRNRNWFVKYFLFSIKKINKSFVYAFICLMLFSLGLYFYNKTEIKTETVSAEPTDIEKSEIENQFKELKF